MKIYKSTVVAYRIGGFGDNLLVAANLWLYAKRHKKRLLICWPNSRYLENTNLNKRTNAFWYLFTLPNNIDGVPIVKRTKAPIKIMRLLGLPYKPSLIKQVYNKCFKNKPKESQEAQKEIDYTAVLKGESPNNERLMIVQQCLWPEFLGDPHDLLPFFQALQPNKTYRAKVEQFAQQYFDKDKKIIGIHIRYYQSSLEYSDHTPFWEDEELALTKIKKAIWDLVDKENKPYTLFLCTDSPFVQSYLLEQNIPNIFLYSKLDMDERDENEELHTNISLQTTENSLIEMFLLAKCDTLVRNTSSWFHYYASLFVNEIIDIK